MNIGCPDSRSAAQALQLCSGPHTGAVMLADSSFRGSSAIEHQCEGERLDFLYGVKSVDEASNSNRRSVESTFCPQDCITCQREYRKCVVAYREFHRTEAFLIILCSALSHRNIIRRDVDFYFGLHVIPPWAL